MFHPVATEMPDLGQVLQSRANRKCLNHQGLPVQALSPLFPSDPLSHRPSKLRLQHCCSVSSSFCKNQAKVCFPLQKHAHPHPPCGKVPRHTVNPKQTEVPCSELQTDALDLENDVYSSEQSTPHDVP